MRKALPWLLAGVFLLLVTAGGTAWLLPGLPLAGVETPVTVLIRPRATVGEVGRLLEAGGLVPDARLFTVGVRLLGAGDKLKYGEYRFSGKLSIRGIVDTLTSGRVELHRLTIPEGFSLREISRRVQEAGLGQSPAFLEASRDPDLLGRLGVPGNSAEGFCFPDTYLLARDLPPDTILANMIGRFREVFDERLSRRAGEMGMSLLEVVTLASIVEKESGDPGEKRLVAAVYHNRLKRGIPLMADPVVIYGIEDFNGNLTRADLRQPGPYNVYLKRGLPPGPICNPGLETLEATLYPAEVDFLYFVSRNDGTHEFSRTLKEHNRAVDRYQRSRN